MDIKILFEDAHLIVCVKPPGIPSERAGMGGLLAERLACGEIFCVHRLDKAAGGVMVYAKTQAAAASLSAQLLTGCFEKEYFAVLPGAPNEESAELCDLLYRDARKNKSFVVKRARRGVREARLAYQVLERSNGLSLVSIRLYTGRSHQIRVQFASRGLPLLGDAKYGSKIRSCPLALFSHTLAFRHPASGAPMKFSVLPERVFPWTCFAIVDKSARQAYIS